MCFYHCNESIKWIQNKVQNIQVGGKLEMCQLLFNIQMSDPGVAPISAEEGETMVEGVEKGTRFKIYQLI